MYSTLTVFVCDSAAAVVREEISAPPPPVHAHDSEKGEGEGGRWGLERSGVATNVSDDRRHHTLQETDSRFMNGWNC